MDTPTQTQTRRSFYSAVIYGLGALITGALAIPAAVYLLIVPKSRRQGAMIEVANLAKLEIGKPQEVTFERTRVDGWRTFQNEKVIAWVVRTSDQAAVAYSPICTHLGCAYHWESEGNRFLCPCHGSAFSMDGKVIEGPAPRPLDRYVSKIEAGRLLIGSEIKKA